MIEERQGDTVLALIKLFVVLLMLIFIMVLCKDSIRSTIDKPTYSEEELLAMTERRKSLRDIERLNDWALMENGIHVKTGLKDDDNLSIVIQNCTSCHSAALITQNRATREGWKDMIVWMQASQGLMDLGIHEPKILDYLATHYAPQKVGRRQNLNIQEIEWYVLNLDDSGN